eukprot:gene34636-39161_t
MAARDLEEIGDYIAQANPIRAGSFVAELRAHCQKICFNPAGYRQRPELSDNLRSCAHGNYVIFSRPRQSSHSSMLGDKSREAIRAEQKRLGLEAN